MLAHAGPEVCLAWPLKGSRKWHHGIRSGPVRFTAFGQ